MAAGHGRLAPITEAGLALFLLYVSKVLFQPVLDHTVSSLVTPISRYSGQQCAVFS